MDIREQNAELAGWREPVARMHEVLDRDELALYCQGIAALEGEVRFPMAEVLVRLRAEEASMLPPGEFLPVFEHCGLMPLLDRWVVRHVVQHLAMSPAGLRYSINLSSQSVDDAAFPGAVADALRQSGVAGASLLFEVEEASLLGQHEALERFATAIKAIGCGLMIDGFGRRSVSFLPLKPILVDYLKVDGTIVRRLLKSASAERKLKAILRVGEVIGFGVIAEMVEEADILGRLKTLEVRYAQGFGIHRPQPIENFTGRAIQG